MVEFHLEALKEILDYKAEFSCFRAERLGFHILALLLGSFCQQQKAIAE